MALHWDRPLAGRTTWDFLICKLCVFGAWISAARASAVNGNDLGTRWFANSHLPTMAPHLGFVDASLAHGAHTTACLNLHPPGGAANRWSSRKARRLPPRTDRRTASSIDARIASPPALLPAHSKCCIGTRPLRRALLLREDPAPRAWQPCLPVPACPPRLSFPWSERDAQALRRPPCSRVASCPRCWFWAGLTSGKGERAAFRANKSKCYSHFLRPVLQATKIYLSRWRPQ